jgi:hypothetical protein
MIDWAKRDTREKPEYMKRFLEAFCLSAVLFMCIGGGFIAAAAKATS